MTQATGTMTFPLQAYERPDPIDIHPRVVRVDSQENITERAIEGAKHRHGGTIISIGAALSMEPTNPVPEVPATPRIHRATPPPSLGEVFDAAVQRQIRNTLPAPTKRCWCVIL